MNFRGHDAEQLLSKFAGEDPGRPATGSRISRRALLRYGSGTAVVAGVGLAGLLELLEHREAIAAGTVIPIVGVTREPDEVEETPHRHTFSVRFRVTSVSPAAIIGDVSGRTEAVISTGSVKEDQHFHLIEGTDVELEALLLSAPRTTSRTNTRTWSASSSWRGLDDPYFFPVYRETARLDLPICIHIGAGSLLPDATLKT